MGKVRVATLDEISAQRGKLVRVEENEIALFRLGNDVVAVTNVCPHQRFSRIYEGEVNNGAVTCPMHGWTFDLRTGKPITGNGNLKTFVVKVINNDVWVEIPETTT
jgi:3-phenylpropionate/trans-cinnamate dioxygenase ferredoxin subunit